MGEWLVENLRIYADTLLIDVFTAEIGDRDLPEFRNYIAKFNLDAEHRILLCAHYDTRPVADRDPDPAKRDKPITGANDGASGVAVLLELARLFSENRPAAGVDMVFFDGEDYGEDLDRMLLGSKRFAGQNADYRPLFGILLDMVGDRDLKIYQELYSVGGSRETVKRIWDLAGDMGFGEIFVPIPRYAVMDDHVPLLQAGIRCINIIDFEYPYWHTSEDTPDKCSSESLRTVGEVINRLVYEIGP
jgi:Zn-dependent M28 family amino/carboxypeptidase